jgi:hypothetical protein
MEARLARQADREEIRDVLRRYCRGVDRRDRALLEAVFAAGLPYGRKLADQLEALPPDDPPGHHFLGNLLVEVDGEEGRSESYFISIVEVEESGTHYTRTRAGRYLSRFERQGGSWRLVEHTTVDDWDRQDEVVGRVAGIGAARGSVTGADPSYGLFGDPAGSDG